MKHNEPDLNVVRAVAQGALKGLSEVEREARGNSTYVYKLKALDQVYYLRILPEAELSFAREVAVHELLYKQGVVVPRVVHFEPRNPVLELSLMIAEAIPGASVEDAPTSEEEQVYYVAGKDLALISQISVDGFGFVIDCPLLGEDRLFQDYYNKHLSGDIALLAQAGLQDREIHCIGEYLDRAGVLLDRTDACLAHGDFDSSHIFHCLGSYSGIIDFGEITGSSPLYDLGHFRVHEKDRGFEALKAGYSAVTPLTEENELEIEVWALFIAVRRLGMIHGRPWQSYRELLLTAVRNQLVRMRHGDGAFLSHSVRRGNPA